MRVGLTWFSWCLAAALAVNLTACGDDGGGGGDGTDMPDSGVGGDGSNPMEQDDGSMTNTGMPDSGMTMNDAGGTDGTDAGGGSDADTGSGDAATDADTDAAMDASMDATVDSGEADDDAGNDPCEGVSDRCSAAGTSCSSDTLITCADNGDGCLVETTTSCSSGGYNFCNDSLDEPACDYDPCLEVANPCPTAGTSCDGNTLVTCALQGECLVETRTDCTMDGGNNACNDSTTAACDYDPCKDAEGNDKPDVCQTDTTECVDNVLVTCEDDGSGCLIAQRLDCTNDPADANHNYCDEAGPECAYDPCLDLENPCGEAGVTCDETFVVTCQLNGDNCLEETRVDCAEGTGETCGDTGSGLGCVDCVPDPICDGQAEGYRECVDNRLMVCRDLDGDSCLDPVYEDCGEDFTCCVGEGDPEDNCPAVAAPRCEHTAEETCNGMEGAEFAAVLDAEGSYPFDTTGAGNDFANYPCPNPNIPFLGAAPDLLFAVDIPSGTSMMITMVGLDGFNADVSFGPWMLQLEECGDGDARAETSCVAVGGRRITEANETDTTARFYLVIDADNPLFSGPNQGTGGLTVEIRELECGDGHRDGSEACDDGNNDADDGCAPDCTLEENFACTQSTPEQPSVCTRRPTDGICAGVVQCAELDQDVPDSSERCCTTTQACGVAVPDRYGASCIERNQEGTEVADDVCPSEDSGWGVFFGIPDLDGCCRADGMCGLTGDFGGGCVERAAMWSAMSDGPAGLLDWGPFESIPGCND